MKKYIALLLIIGLLLGLSACSNDRGPAVNSAPDETSNVIPDETSNIIPDETSNVIDTTTEDMEILRAIAYGFVPKEMQGDWNQPVTYEQFCAMLGGIISLTDSSLSTKWEALTVDLPDAVMTRQEAMVACLLAGQLMGLTEANDYTEEQQLGELNNVEMVSKMYPDWNQSVTISTDGNGEWDNYIMGGIFYGFRQISLVNRLSLFLLNNGDPGLQKEFTRTQAIQAATRLYESQRRIAKAAEKVYSGQLQTYLEQIKDDPNLSNILSSADKRREDILNTKMNIQKAESDIPGQTYTGTAYYVSTNGDDNAEGTSPETAWATLSHVNKAKLNPGDAVFFERGKIWRGQLICADGVTYSAYGEGTKPSIYGSPENGTGADKWALVDGTKNIWVYYKDMYDTGGIVLNDGEDWATRRIGLWNGEEYVDPLDKTTAVDIMALQDLEMLSEVDYSGYSTEEAKYELLKQGKLYLRCDEGNPGEIYHSIEFLCQSDPHSLEYVIQGGDYTVIDNLCVKYTSMSGIFLSSNSIVQNCEVGWVGGGVMNFGDFGGGAGVVRVGDCISAGRGPNSAGVNNSIVNNYCHHSYDQGIVIEMGPGYAESLHYMENLTVKGNLTERTSGGIVIAEWTALNTGWDNGMLFKDVIIEDNYVMYSGFGWSHISLDFDWGIPGPVNNGNSSIMFGFPACAGENIRVNNNVFCLSRFALVSSKYADGDQLQKYDATFSDNLYVQNNGGTLAEWVSPEDSSVVSSYYNSDNAKQTISDVLGDTSAEVYSTK